MCSGPHTTRGWVKVGGGVGWGGKMKNNKQDEQKLKMICAGGCVWMCVCGRGRGRGRVCGCPCGMCVVCVCVCVCGSCVWFVCPSCVPLVCVFGFFVCDFLKFNFQTFNLCVRKYIFMFFNF